MKSENILKHLPLLEKAIAFDFNENKSPQNVLILVEKVSLYAASSVTRKEYCVSKLKYVVSSQIVVIEILPKEKEK